VPYRYNRIMSLLAGRQQHTVESMTAIQRDVRDTYALLLIRYFRGAWPLEGRVGDAQRLLERWDGAMRKDRPEPLIFSAWARALSKRIFADEFGDAFDDHWSYQAAFTLRVLSDTAGSGRWCDDRRTDAFEDCPAQIRAALSDAVQELTAAYGENITAWRWGKAHHAFHENRGLGLFPLISGFFNREVEVGGGWHTLYRHSNRMSDTGHPYRAFHGAGYRAVYDLASPDNSRYIIATGQSGNAFSPHYDDLLPLWAQGRYILLPARPKVTVGITDLRPRGAQSGGG
jgi:penicillin amidase